MTAHDAHFLQILLTHLSYPPSVSQKTLLVEMEVFFPTFLSQIMFAFVLCTEVGKWNIIIINNNLLMLMLWIFQQRVYWHKSYRIYRILGNCIDQRAFEEQHRHADKNVPSTLYFSHYCLFVWQGVGRVHCPARALLRCHGGSADLTWLVGPMSGLSAPPCCCSGWLCIKMCAACCSPPLWMESPVWATAESELYRIFVAGRLC